MTEALQRFKRSVSERHKIRSKADVTPYNNPIRRSIDGR